MPSYFKPKITFLLLAILSAFSTILLTSCTSSEKPKLTIAISPWPGYEPLALALHKGFYQDIEVRIVRFATPIESYRALRDGLVDVAAFTADEALHYAGLNRKPKIFHILDVSHGGDSIVAHPNIKNLDDLKGKRVGVENSTLSNYLIHRAMDFSQNNLSPIKDFTLIPIEIGQHAKAYKEGVVDALVTYEPSKTKVMQLGAHEIFNSSQIPFEVIDILITNENVLIEKKAALQTLIKAWYRAIEWIKQNPDEAFTWMAQQEGLTAEEFKKAYNTMLIPTQQEVSQMLGQGEDSLVPVLNRLVKLMVKNGGLSKPIKVEPLLVSPLSLMKPSNLEEENHAD